MKLKSHVIVVGAAVMLFVGVVFNIGAYATETKVTDTIPYNTASFVGFLYQNGNNLYREDNGTLHMAIVQNYELWYFKSTNNGTNWTSEKIITGQEGDLRLAALTVDQNGKVFIGFTTNPGYNYAASGAPPYGEEFYFDLYCANNSSGSWSVTKLYTHSTSNYGALVSGMAVDGNNNVHVFASNYGWWNYGGTAWEWKWDSSTQTWGPQATIFTINIGVVDRVLKYYFRPLVNSNGDITVFMKRDGSTPGVNEPLFYVTNTGGSWSAPVVIDDTIDCSYSGLWTFDAAIDANDNIYFVYYSDNSSGYPEIKFSSDMGVTKSVIFTGTNKQKIYDLKLHSNGNGKLTTVIRREADTTILAERPAGGSWSVFYDFPTVAPDGDVFYLANAQTDTCNGSFSDSIMSYLDSEVVGGPPYGPHYLYYNSAVTIPKVKFPWEMFLPAITIKKN